MEVVLTIIFCISAILCVAYIGFSIESKGYNNGICLKCGEKLRLFDYDSQGCRGYSCSNPKCSYKTWVSYRTVDKNHTDKI